MDVKTAFQNFVEAYAARETSYADELGFTSKVEIGGSDDSNRWDSNNPFGTYYIAKPDLPSFSAMEKFLQLFAPIDTQKILSACVSSAEPDPVMSTENDHYGTYTEYKIYRVTFSHLANHLAYAFSKDPKAWLRTMLNSSDKSTRLFASQLASTWHYSGPSR